MQLDRSGPLALNLVFTDSKLVGESLFRFDLGRFYEFHECKYIFNISYNLRRSIASTICPWISRNKYKFYIVQYTFILPGSC